MKLKNLPQGLAEAIVKCPLIIGIGPTAWPRLVPSLYFPKYKILTYYDCLVNELIKEFGIEVFSLRATQPELEISPVTPGQILSTSLAQKFLASQRESFVFLIYKTSNKLEKICEENNWQFIGNKKSVGGIYEDKRVFKEILPKVGVEPIPGDNIPIEDLTPEKFIYYQKKLGQEKLVLQLAEMTYGGGCGTLFLDSPQKLGLFNQRLAEIKKELVGKKKKIETVNVAPYITGISASVTACATRFGVLTGPVQTQIIDIEEVGAKKTNRSGNFSGHDWSFCHYSEEVQQQVSMIAERLGEYMYKNGYKGIFGVDLLIDEKTQKVWPVECNPRETDVFPMLSMLQLEQDIIPLDVFHNLEFLGVDYQIDFEAINKSYKKIFEGSQMILFNRSEKIAINRKSLIPGVFRINEGKLQYLRPGLMPSDLEKEDEFLITETTIDKPGQVFTPSGRICRLIQKRGVITANDSLKEDFKRIIEAIYSELKLVQVETGLQELHGVKFLFGEKLVDAITNPELNEADVLNVYAKVPGGFWRPQKVAWRKELTDEPVIDQIRSKRARKQIRADEEKIPKLEIELKTYSTIDQETFQKWLRFYKEKILEKEKGAIIVTDDWLSKKEEQRKKVGAILAFRGEELIGGDLFFEANKILCVGYGMAERIQGLAGGLGLLLDYHFLLFAQEQGYKQVSFGQDSNLYGFDLSLGLLSYKAKLGFKPLPATNKVWMSTLFKNFEKFTGPLAFFAGEKESLKLVIITESGNKEEDLGIYPPLGIEGIEYYSREEILEKHRQFLEAYDRN